MADATWVVADQCAAELSGLLSWPKIKPGQTIATGNTEFELFAEHPGAKLMPMGAYSYSHSWFRCTRIGRYCSIAKNVRVMGDSHPHNWVSTSPRFYIRRGRKICQMPNPRQPLSYPDRSSTPVTIGHDVWIGQDVLLRDGITVGDGAVIAAGSVVTKDVQPYSMVGGAPARLIRPRFDPGIAQRLHALEWWMAEPADIIDLPFDSPEDFLAAAEPAQAGWRVKPLDYRSFARHVEASALRGVEQA